MKIDKKIKRIAEQILELERDLQKGKNVEENQAKLEKIANSLSIEEMIIIDDYIDTIMH